MSTGTKRSVAKPKPRSKGARSGSIVRDSQAKDSIVNVLEQAKPRKSGLTKSETVVGKGRRNSTNTGRSLRSPEAEIASLTRRVALLERELAELMGNREVLTPEFDADCAEIERVLRKRFKSVSTRPLSAGQVAIDVTDVAFKGLSWMKRHALLDPILNALSERAFFRVIETHLRTPDETN